MAIVDYPDLPQCAGTEPREVTAIETDQSVGGIPRGRSYNLTPTYELPIVHESLSEADYWTFHNFWNANFKNQFRIQWAGNGLTYVGHANSPPSYEVSTGAYKRYTVRLGMIAKIQDVTIQNVYLFPESWYVRIDVEIEVDEEVTLIIDGQTYKQMSSVGIASFQVYGLAPSVTYEYTTTIRSDIRVGTITTTAPVYLSGVSATTALTPDISYPVGQEDWGWNGLQYVPYSGVARIGVARGPYEYIGGVKCYVPYKGYTEGETVTQGDVRWHQNINGDTRLIQFSESTGTCPAVWTLTHAAQGGYAADGNGGSWLSGCVYEPYLGQMCFKEVEQLLADPANGNFDVTNAEMTLTGNTEPSLFQGYPDIPEWTVSGIGGSIGGQKTLPNSASYAGPLTGVATFKLTQLGATGRTRFNFRNAGTSGGISTIGVIFYPGTGETELLEANGEVDDYEIRALGNNYFQIAITITADKATNQLWQFYWYPSGGSAEVASGYVQYMGLAKTDKMWEPLPYQGTKPALGVVPVSTAAEWDAAGLNTKGLLMVGQNWAKGPLDGSPAEQMLGPSSTLGIHRRSGTGTGTTYRLWPATNTGPNMEFYLDPAHEHVVAGYWRNQIGDIEGCIPGDALSTATGSFTEPFSTTTNTTRLNHLSYYNRYVRFVLVTPENIQSDVMPGWFDQYFGPDVYKRLPTRYD